MKQVYFFSGPHPIHESLIKYPPEDFNFTANMKLSDFSILKEYNSKHALMKNTATKCYNLLKLPRVMYFRKRCDLIHTSSGVIPLNNKPWIVDVEYASSFVGLQENKMTAPYLKKVAKYLSNDNCKKIIPFSDACKNSIINSFKGIDENFKSKIEVVHHAVAPYDGDKKRGNGDAIRLLHVSGLFFDKGGRELVKAFEILNKKYDIELDMIVGAPKHHEAYFEEFTKKYEAVDNLNIIKKKISRKDLFENYYSKADIFVLPTYLDLYPMVFFESMSAGLPQVSTNVFAVPEIVENGRNGLLIDSPISPFDDNYVRTAESIRKYRYDVLNGDFSRVVNQLVETISLLIEDDKLRKSMSNESLKMIKSGKFSIKHRNEQLRRIYQEALE